MNEQERIATENNLVQMGKHLDSVTHVEVQDIQTQSSEWAPGVKFKLESRAFSVLFQISKRLDKFGFRVVEVDSSKSDSSEVVYVTSDDDAVVKVV